MKRIFLGLAAISLAAAPALAQLAPQPERPTSLAIDSGTKTATATAGAATLNKSAGVVTSEANYTLTITDSAIAAADQVFASVSFGSATAGTPEISTVTPAAGSVVIVVHNATGAAALNGTIKVAFATIKN